MFDVGFGELVLISLIGLLVLGPQRLPKVAAEIGKWVGRARRTATQLRRQLEREIELSELETPPPRPQPPPTPPPQQAAPPPAETPGGAAPTEPTIAAPPGSSDSNSVAQGVGAGERLDTTDNTHS